VSGAAAGDVVSVPAGTCTWSTGVSWDDKGITVKGAGADQTTIVMGAATTAFKVTTASLNLRITGFTLQLNNLGAGIDLRGDHRSFRIDHNTITNAPAGQRPVEIYGESSVLESRCGGIIDHNKFSNNRQTDIVVYGDSEDSWSQPVVLGGDEGVVFVENNSFIYDFCATDDPASHAISSNTGSRYVFRYNTIDACYGPGAQLDAPIDAHGYCFYKRGSISYEIYGNTLKSARSWRGMFLRGGTGVVFDNAFLGDEIPDDVDWPNPIHLTNYRSCTACGGTGVSPATCEEGYPCQDQITDLYIWGNTLDGEEVGATVDNTLCDSGEMDLYIQQGRDYFTVPKPGYTPYTYPHPLTGIVFEDGFESGGTARWSSTSP